MRSKAAVFEGADQPLRLTHFELPKLCAGEVLVRIRCATICGSDLHTFFGRRSSPAPGVPGHEMVGEVVEMAEGGVRDYYGQPLVGGDRVTWSMVWCCGKCFYCGIGLESKCERLYKYGHERLQEGRELTGAYAEHCQLRAGSAIFRVPSAIADVVAAPANCATATVAAVLRNAGSLKGGSVAIMGAGMLGLTACAMARSAGASQVISIEGNADRRAVAARFGATRAIGTGGESKGVAMDLTDGKGVDVALEFAGTPEAGEAALGMLRCGGHLVMAGTVFPTRPMAVDGESVVRRMLRISGVYNYRPSDLGEALRFLGEAQGRYPFEGLVGARFSLDAINEAVAYAEKEKPVRVAVIP